MPITIPRARLLSRVSLAVPPASRPATVCLGDRYFSKSWVLPKRNVFHSEVSRSDPSLHVDCRDRPLRGGQPMRQAVHYTQFFFIRIVILKALEEIFRKSIRIIPLGIFEHRIMVFELFFAIFITVLRSKLVKLSFGFYRFLKVILRVPLGIKKN